MSGTCLIVVEGCGGASGLRKGFEVLYSVKTMEAMEAMHEVATTSDRCGRDVHPVVAIRPKLDTKLSSHRKRRRLVRVCELVSDWSPFWSTS